MSDQHRREQYTSSIASWFLLREEDNSGDSLLARHCPPEALPSAFEAGGAREAATGLRGRFRDRMMNDPSHPEPLMGLADDFVSGSSGTRPPAGA